MKKAVIVFLVTLFTTSLFAQVRIEKTPLTYQIGNKLANACYQSDRLMYAFAQANDASSYQDAKDKLMRMAMGELALAENLLVAVFDSYGRANGLAVLATCGLTSEEQRRCGLNYEYFYQERKAKQIAESKKEYEALIAAGAHDTGGNRCIPVVRMSSLENVAEYIRTRTQPDPFECRYRIVYDADGDVTSYAPLDRNVDSEYASDVFERSGALVLPGTKSFELIEKNVSLPGEMFVKITETRRPIGHVDRRDNCLFQLLVKYDKAQDRWVLDKKKSDLGDWGYNQADYDVVEGRINDELEECGGKPKKTVMVKLYRSRVEYGKMEKEDSYALAVDSIPVGPVVVIVEISE